jgi:putative ABC transport system permease protein
MGDLILAFRNACRNRRRSLVTVSALALCATGLILFAGYVMATFTGDETRTTCGMGHLQIFRRDFPEKGIGSPGSFVIENHKGLEKVLREDPQLGPMINVLTGQLTFSGLANYYEKNTSAAFIGFGVYPEDYAVFSAWNPFGLAKPDLLPINDLLYERGPWLDDADLEGGSIGIGLAEILEIATPDSPDGSVEAGKGAAPAFTREGEASDTPGTDAIVEGDSDLPNFDVLEAASMQADGVGDGRARIELLSVPEAGSSPNIQTLAVWAVRPFENVQLDERLVLMHIEHASELLFPGQPTQVNSLRLLLHEGKDVDAAAVRIREILARDYPELECRTWIELAPFYLQITAYLKVIFMFMFTIIASIVVFTIYNTLAASIVERTSEIGTLRAMGVSRGRIAGLFIYEAVFMGIAGGLLGVGMAIVLGIAFNHMEFYFNPPSTSYYTKVEVLIFHYPMILIVGFGIAVVAAVVSAVVPSVNASRLAIVDALRHA